jgi:predicted nucleic acid-binding protein
MRLPSLRPSGKNAQRGSSDGQRPLAVLDSNVLIAALFAADERSTTLQVVNAALLGACVPVSSGEMVREVIEVLGRKFDVAEADAHKALDPLWDMTIMVEPAPDGLEYERAVNDHDDAMVLRTACGLLGDPQLAARPLYIVTQNVKDFRGDHFYGFHIVDSHGFLRELDALAQLRGAV